MSSIGLSEAFRRCGKMPWFQRQVKSAVGAESIAQSYIAYCPLPNLAAQLPPQFPVSAALITIIDLLTSLNINNSPCFHFLFSDKLKKIWHFPEMK